MTIDSLRGVLRAEPFRPFVLHLADGRRIRITHPELVAFLGTGRTLFVSYPRTDHFELVDLLLINSIEVGAPRNGGKNKRKAG